MSFPSFRSKSKSFSPRIGRMSMLALAVMCLAANGAAAAEPARSSVWVSDNGDGTYTNPVLYADYSDPDVVRVGGDFYMTASSFNCVPGLPILHSKDLVNWDLVGYALDRNRPEEHFRVPRHAQGVWAPSFRHHEGEFYIYWGDPDFGIYMVKAADPRGPWETPVLVKEGRGAGLIDPCPLWDDDGRAYLVHGIAGSRAGIKSVLFLQEMTPDGTSVIGEPVLVFDGHDAHPTVEGPKFYKRGDTYYILAPAGGVTHGWQLALRSKNVLGPYEEKIVMHRGSTDINGPHQGGLLELASGESWFVHFQDLGPYGRVIHLNPVNWTDGWPVMGIDADGDGTGEPVRTFRKPDVGGVFPIVAPPESDEFDGTRLGLQWQWHANPLPFWAVPNPARSMLRLYAAQLPEKLVSYWDVPHLLLQKFPAPAFTATTRFSFAPRQDGESTGLIVMGRDYARLTVTRTPAGLEIAQAIARNADRGGVEEVHGRSAMQGNEFWFRVRVEADASTRFSYSTDGENFTPIGEPFTARQGGWIGAKVGLFCSRSTWSNDSGWADFDWFRITP
jgi:beta-xylosidase